MKFSFSSPSRRIGSSRLLGQSAIPFVGLSSGSVSAPGAISAITALPAVYAHAYCWFPANILATAIAAGWHYCTFSTTTAGVAFLNTWTSGTPTIPAAPTAVTDGKGAFTGDIAEEMGPAIAVPAGALGPNGAARLWLTYEMTSNANVKTGRVRYSGAAGTIFSSHALASGISSSHVAQLQNRGAANSQVSGGASAGSFAGVSANPLIASAVDTAAATTIQLSLQRATATDNLVLSRYLAELLPG